MDEMLKIAKKVSAGLFLICLWLLMNLPVSTAAPVKKIVGDITWPKQWQVFAPLEKDDPVLSADVLKTIPEEIEVGGRKLKGQTVTFFAILSISSIV